MTEQKTYRWSERGVRYDEDCARCGRESEVDNCTDLCERCYGAPRVGRSIEAGPRIQGVLASLGLELNPREDDDG